MFLLSLIWSADCDLVISLAQGLNMHVVDPFRMSYILNNCCTSFGVYCTNSKVTIIDWASLGLNGTINATAIPLVLERFALNLNKVQGTFPNISLHTINYLYWYENKLNGSLIMPVTSIDMRVSDNNLSGNILPYPKNNALFHGFNNKLTGLLPPMKPHTLDISNNLLSGSIPTLLSNLRRLIVFGNLFTGYLPPIVSNPFDILLGTSLYSTNRISGDIVLHSPERVLIYGNNISSITIANTSNLVLCDIRYNPISFQNISALPQCIPQSSTQLVSTKQSTLLVQSSQTFDSSITLASESSSTIKLYTTSNDITLTVLNSNSIRQAPQSTMRTHYSSTIPTSTSSMAKMTRAPQTTPIVPSQASSKSVSLLKSTSTRQPLKSKGSFPIYIEVLPLSDYNFILTISSVFRSCISFLLLIYVFAKLIKRSWVKLPRNKKKKGFATLNAGY